MACCLLCFDSSPHRDNPREGRIGIFQVPMLSTLWRGQPVCCLTYCFPPCMAAWVRLKVIGGNIDEYVCCQGYFDRVPCVKSGKCGERTCPHLCLCLESTCCLGPSLSASRLLVMDRFDIRPDPCDNQLIRLSNCVNALSCVCDVASIFVRDLRHAAHLLHSVSDFIFYTTVGMMAAQTMAEHNYHQAREGIVVAGVVAEGVPFQKTGGGDCEPLLEQKKALL